MTIIFKSKEKYIINKSVPVKIYYFVTLRGNKCFSSSFRDASKTIKCLAKRIV